MSERVFFQEGGVLVTNTRVVLGAGQTFALANVTSCRVVVRNNVGPAVFFGLLGAASLALGVIGSQGPGSGGFVCSVFGAVFLLFAIASLVTSEARLMIGTAGGEQTAMRGNQKLIARINDAITQAIVSRG